MKSLFTALLLSLFALDADSQITATMPYANANQADMPVGSWNCYSYYLAPWKSYMDTWPGSWLLDSIGVNFHPGAGLQAGTATVEASAGITHGRFEANWIDQDYSTNALNPGKLSAYTDTITALKNAGIRPLVLIDNNSGGICPSVALSLTATANSAVGATTITVYSTSGIIAGKTGLTGQGNGYQVYPLITSFNSGTGVCTLSAPLLVAVPTGTVNCLTLKYHMLSTGGATNSFSAETMTGWSDFVTSICTLMNSILGNNNFDLEVMNEDVSALDDNNFYSPANTSTGALTYTSTQYPTYTLNGNTAGDNREVLVPITVDAAAAFPGVRVINGFANERPQDNAFNTSPGVLAMTRHYYSVLDTTDPMNQGNSGVVSSSLGGVAGLNTPNCAGTGLCYPPINAAFGWDGTPTNTYVLPSGPNNRTINNGSAFIPSFTQSAPESLVGWDTYYLYMCIDLQPFASLRYDGGSYPYYGPHWRGGLNPISGQTLNMWETETNSYRSAWVTNLASSIGQSVTYQPLVDLYNYVAAKDLLRTYVFHNHKGVQTVCVFADRNVNTPYSLSIIPEAFFTALSANGGVLDSTALAATGSQLAAVQDLTSYIKTNTGSGGSFTVSPLTVTYLQEPSPQTEFSGDGTSAHPDRHNIDDFGVFPYQLNANTYAVAYYVVTRNICQNWGVDTSNVLDTANYRMPDETFNVTLSGLTNATHDTVSCYDPLTNTNPTATITSSTSTTITVSLPTTDSPRFLLITTGVPSAPGTLSTSGAVTPPTPGTLSTVKQ